MGERAIGDLLRDVDVSVADAEVERGRSVVVAFAQHLHQSLLTVGALHRLQDHPHDLGSKRHENNNGEGILPCVTFHIL